MSEFSFNTDDTIVKVTLSDGKIVAESSNWLSIQDLLDVLNGSDDQDYQDSILDLLPEDYDFIMNQENYGILFAMGSPQTFECGWKFTYEVDDTLSRLTITGLR